MMVGSGSPPGPNGPEDGGAVDDGEDEEPGEDEILPEGHRDERHAVFAR